MKIRLAQYTLLVFFAVMSMSAFAGGEGCNSKKGHGKHEMSAEALQEFKDSHTWMFSESTDADAANPGHESLDKSGQSQKSIIEDLVEI